MRVEVFSEAYSGRGGLIREMDTRAKLIFVSACLLLAVVSSSTVVPFAIGVVCLGLVAASGASLLAVALRIAEPLIFAAVLAVIQVFLAHGEALYSLHILGAVFSVSPEGIHKGLLIISRVFGAVSSVLFLTMTTSVNRLLSAAARLGAPEALVEVSLLAYRYVFVLIEDAVTVYHAQRGRLGYSGFMRGIRSLTVLAGAVFLRAFSQAEATGEAMAMRGYTGEYLPLNHESFRVTDTLLLFTGLSLCAIAYLWT